jgi:hypothetical protein
MTARPRLPTGALCRRRERRGETKHVTPGKAGTGTAQRWPGRMRQWRSSCRSAAVPRHRDKSGAVAPPLPDLSRERRPPPFPEPGAAALRASRSLGTSTRIVGCASIGCQRENIRVPTLNRVPPPPPALPHCAAERAKGTKLRGTRAMMRAAGAPCWQRAARHRPSCTLSTAPPRTMAAAARSGLPLLPPSPPTPFYSRASSKFSQRPWHEPNKFVGHCFSKTNRWSGSTTTGQWKTKRWPSGYVAGHAGCAAV